MYSFELAKKWSTDETVSFGKHVVRNKEQCRGEFDTQNAVHGIDTLPVEHTEK